jgi:hypothetical protein
VIHPAGQTAAAGVIVMAPGISELVGGLFITATIVVVEIFTLR